MATFTIIQVALTVGISVPVPKITKNEYQQHAFVIAWSLNL